MLVLFKLRFEEREREKRNERIRLDDGGKSSF